MDAEYAKKTAKMAYKMASITEPKKEIDVLEIEDNFPLKKKI